jgi:proteasome lid subunit RPN8/RPN11
MDVIERDADALASSEYLPRTLTNLTGERRPGFQVVCRRSVLNAIRAHGHETLDVEICGVLVGDVFRDELGAFLHIEECIRGEHSSNHAAQVTFTSDTWSHIHREMDRYPGKRILGWYHTHPDFGIFLSAADMFIHENFFNIPWQVAYVYDPVREQDGMFVWRAGKAKREPILVEEDTPQVDEKPKSPPLPPVVNAAASRVADPKANRIERLARRLTWVIVLQLLVLAVAVVWPIVWPAAWDWMQEQVHRPPTLQAPRPIDPMANP